MTAAATGLRAVASLHGRSRDEPVAAISMPRRPTRPVTGKLGFVRPKSRVVSRRDLPPWQASEELTRAAGVFQG